MFQFGSWKSLLCLLGEGTLDSIRLSLVVVIYGATTIG